MSFVDECYINPMFCKEFGQEMLVVEPSICIQEHKFYRPVKCGMSGVIRILVVSTCRVCTNGTAKHIFASSYVLSFELQEATNQRIIAILSKIDLVIHNDWIVFVNLC